MGGQVVKRNTRRVSLTFRKVCYFHSALNWTVFSLRSSQQYGMLTFIFLVRKYPPSFDPCFTHSFIYGLQLQVRMGLCDCEFEQFCDSQSA